MTHFPFLRAICQILTQILLHQLSDSLLSVTPIRHAQQSQPHIMVSLAPFVLRRPWLTKMLMPAATWYTNAAGYRKLGLRYDFLHFPRLRRREETGRQEGGNATITMPPDSKVELITNYNSIKYDGTSGKVSIGKPRGAACSTDKESAP